MADKARGPVSQAGSSRAHLQGTMVFQAHSGFSLRSSDEQQRTSALRASDFRLRVASQPFSPMAPFASISANILRGVGEPSTDAKARREPNTSVDFSTELCHRAHPCSALAGLG